MISSRKAEFTFCKMISTQWEHLGQEPGGSVTSGHKESHKACIPYRTIHTIRERLHGLAQRGLQEVSGLDESTENPAHTCFKDEEMCSVKIATDVKEVTPDHKPSFERRKKKENRCSKRQQRGAA